MYLVLNVMSVMLVVFDAVWQEEVVVKDVGRKELVLLEEFVMNIVNGLGHSSRLESLYTLSLYDGSWGGSSELQQGLPVR